MELFNSNLEISYGQFYMVSGDSEYDLDAAFKGQTNGLCGAADAPNLVFITGLHTGHVELGVYLHQSMPALEESWEDVVEVSYQVTGELSIEECCGSTLDPLPIPPGTYRVRYSGRKMDEAREEDCVLEDEPAIDSYRVDFWPTTEPSADQIIRQHSEQAAYWHTAWSQ